MLDNVEFRWVLRDGEKVLQYKKYEAPREGAAYWDSGRESSWIDVEIGEE